MTTKEYRKQVKEFRAYCSTLTDDQVVNVCAKECEAQVTNPDRLPHYEAASVEKASRGL